MKRIISLIMSVLMIATMFCGMAVTSTAADQLPAHVTIVASEPVDGVVDVEIWVKDNSAYGFHNVGFGIDWDETKLEPVTTTVAGVESIFEITPMVDFVDAFNTYKNDTGSTAAVGSAYSLLKAGRVTLGQYLTGEAPYNWFAINHSGSAAYTCGFFFDSAVVADVMGDDAVAALGIDSEKGIKLGTASFKIKDGATGEAKIEAYTENGQVLLTRDDFVTFDGLKAEEAMSFTPAVINCTTEPAAPALPENVNTLEVQTGVSARKDTYNGDNIGLRFTTKVDVDNWTGVSEIGTAIVKKGTKPGVDTTLTVPARVDINGKYLQAHTKNEDGKYVFTPGITTADTNVTYTGVISNIKPANVDVEFEAYAYIIVDGVTYYSANSESASYNEIFNAAQNDPTIAD